ncbi:MAG: integrin alpha [Planctomycetaceae bacterium]
MLIANWVRQLISENMISLRVRRGKSRGLKRKMTRNCIIVAPEQLECRALLTDDFGDAPDTGAGTGPGNYETLLANDGPRHTIVGGLRLGKFVGGDLDANQNSTATGDDIGADDEDGVASPLGELRFTFGTQPVVTLSATNTTGNAATLYGWIDFNNNGLFDNTSERASIIVPTGTNNGLVSLNFPTISTSFTGTTFARFRLSTDAAAANPTGAAANGEVEDYAVSITKPTTGVVKSGGSTKIDDNTTNGPDVANQDQFGNSLTRIGDIDGDGVTDLAVGAHQDDTVASNTGAVHILRMNADGSVKATTKIALAQEAGSTLVEGDVFEFPVASAGGY